MRPQAQYPQKKKKTRWNKRRPTRNRKKGRKRTKIASALWPRTAILEVMWEHQQQLRAVYPPYSTALFRVSVPIQPPYSGFLWWQPILTALLLQLLYYCLYILLYHESINPSKKIENPASAKVHFRVLAVYQILFGWKTCTWYQVNIIMKPTNSPT